MDKILICFGTRPEAIKMAPLILELKKNSSFKIAVCVTAQHREMLDQVLFFFKITPDYDLNLMQSNQTLNQLSSRILSKIDVVLDDFKPELVLVHGDTTTSSMVALASFHKHIKVAHIEAGLRTYNKNAPFPEEINRQITGRIADYHFAPTRQAADNLIYNEKIDSSNVYVTGNTVIDALLLGIKHINIERLEILELDKKLDKKKRIILMTGHRRENFGEKFESICEALLELSKRDDIQIIYPVHLNPKVQEPVTKILKNIDNILLVNPLDYEIFIWLMNKSYLIITDSGGVQEEAPSLKIPVLVTREVTERQEAVEVNAVKLVGTTKKTILTEAIKLLDNKEEYNKMISNDNPYGDGNASRKIKDIISLL